MAYNLLSLSTFTKHCSTVVHGRGRREPEYREQPCIKDPQGMSPGITLLTLSLTLSEALTFQNGIFIFESVDKTVIP